MTDYTNISDKYKGYAPMQMIIDDTTLRQIVVKALLFKLECLAELLEMGTANETTQTECSQCNAALLAIESRQLELPF